MSSIDDTTRQLKAQFAEAIGSLNELFPDWSEEDLLYLLQETQGDVEVAVVRITEGHASQWGEVKKKTKERSKSKGPFTGAEGGRPSFSSSTRGRSRGGIEARGRGGRSDRGRSRGGRTNGRTSDESAPVSTPAPTDAAASAPSDPAPTTEPTPSAAESAAPATETPAAETPAETTNGWASAASAAAPEQPAPTTTTSTKAASTVIKPGTKMSWASIAKPAPKPAEPPKPKPAAEPIPEPAAESEPASATNAWNNDYASSTAAPHIEESAWGKTSAQPASESYDEVAPLTKENVESVVDDAPPAPTSTLASTIDTPSTTTSATVSSKVPPGLASATKNARSPAYSRVLKQDAPVVMPGSVQAQVSGLQFGSLTLADNQDEESSAYESTPKEQLDSLASQKTYQQEPASEQAPIAQTAPAAQVPAPGLSGFGQQPQPHRYQQQPQVAQTQQQKAFEPFSQAPYTGYPAQSHMPAFGGFPSDFQNPYGADPQRQGYGYYAPYQQPAISGAAAPDSLQRTASASLEQLTPSSTSTQPARFGVGSEATSASPATASPGITTQQSQYNMHPYYMSPAYTAYYLNNFQGYYAQQQSQAQHFGHQQPQAPSAQAKSVYGQQQQSQPQQSQFYDHYSRQQQMPMQQPQAQQPQQAAGQGVSSLGGSIPDFLQMEDASKGAGARPSSSAGQQQQTQQQPQQGIPQQPMPQQQNVYGGFSQYPPYNSMGSQQGRQSGWGGYSH
ncbi:hypothetical protein BZA70DRAFT_287535 [Myxozyma melibiosi]|uniref:RNA polymerase II degradation factor 1 n=1 Tax=Myxozyma melibiosi TaxID=54550 RepID=A0ABR1FEC8_9ASCO